MSKKVVEALTEILAEQHHLIVEPSDKAHHHVVKTVRGELARFLKPGDTVKSSDLDDFQNEGFKVKETPKKE